MADVLVVEDNRELSRLIERELAAAGHRVRIAPDGELALRLHREAEPQAIVLDWMLPGIDGLEVLRRIRQHAPTPVLILTARGEEIDRVMGLELGADDYLTKPFSARELVARVRALLRRRELLEHQIEADRDDGGPPLSWGNILLDPESRRATVADDEIVLTPIEFKLLRLLMRNPGRVFSRSYLLENVWDFADASGGRAVDNTVMRLRRKLGVAGESIETVRGVGYRLPKRA